ncbi:MAG TPA: hypothetical protein VM452_00545 [Caulifigura sp.]|nr:hypothetical protein [Caulifigura sp.]
MSRILRAAAVVAWMVAASGLVAADDVAPVSERHARLMALAKTLPVVDTMKDDCPDFDLNCHANLGDGTLQVDVQYRNKGHFGIVATNSRDDSLIAAWTNRRFVGFDPSTPHVVAVDSVDLEFVLQGTTERFCDPGFQYQFGKQRSIVRVDLPSMLLTAGGKLVDEGSTPQVTRLAIIETERRRRLSIEFNHAAKSVVVVASDPEALSTRGRIQLNLAPTYQEPLVRLPDKSEFPASLLIASVDAAILTPEQIQEIGQTLNRVISLHMGLMSSKCRKDAKAAGAKIDWAKLGTHRDQFGGRLTEKLVFREPPTAEEIARRARVAELARLLPALDTRQPDCPPFSLRGRLPGDDDASDLVVRHRGKNELDAVVMTVKEGLPYLACVGGQAIGLDPATPQILLVNHTRMQFAAAGGEGKSVDLNFAWKSSNDFSKDEFEQFANIDIRSIALGARRLVDCGSTADVIRLRILSSRGNDLDIECRPNLAEPRCYVRAPDEDGRAAEFEITIHPRFEAPLAIIPTPDAVKDLAYVRALPTGGPSLADIPELLVGYMKCLLANRAFDRESRETYIALDKTGTDWEEVGAQQLRMGRRLRELMAVPRLAPTPDDTPITVQLTAEAGSEAR